MDRTVAEKRELLNNIGQTTTNHEAFVEFELENLKERAEVHNTGPVSRNRWDRRRVKRAKIDQLVNELLPEAEKKAPEQKASKNKPFERKNKQNLTLVAYGDGAKSGRIRG